MKLSEALGAIVNMGQAAVDEFAAVRRVAGSQFKIVLARVIDGQIQPRPVIEKGAELIDTTLSEVDAQAGDWQPMPLLIHA